MTLEPNHPVPVTLTGKLIRLEPLLDAHVPDLTRAGQDPEIWRYMRYGYPHTEEQMKAWVQMLLCGQEAGEDLPFAVIWLANQRAIGATRYLNISANDRMVEIGGTWYAREYQRTGVNTEAKYLLLRHAFQTLSCVRVQFKADLRNERSIQAIERLGAVREGVLRKHMRLPDGTFRDSVFFSILDNEWPAVKTHLETLLKRHDD